MSDYEINELMSEFVTISDFQNMFKSIYPENEYLDEVLFLANLFEDIGKFSLIMRYQEYYKLEKMLPILFAWLCGFANKYDKDLELLIWTKYKRFCPYCKSKEKCHCFYLDKKYEWPDFIEKDERENKNFPESLIKWEEMFIKIYSNINKHLSFSSIGFHLIEEVGELSNSYRIDKKKILDEELADIFAWIMALKMKLNIEKTFAELVLINYPNRVY